VAKSEALKDPAVEDLPEGNPDGNNDEDAQTVATSAVDVLSVAPSH
tara:strand:+ start:241 stop:378 length:138 start_codon:yes stop_codon:yes gene_type:complete